MATGADWADILINSLNSAVDTKIEDQRFTKRWNMQEASKDKDKKESQAFQLRLLDISRDQAQAAADAQQKRADESWQKQFAATSTNAREMTDKANRITLTKDLTEKYQDVNTLSAAIRAKLGKGDQSTGAEIEQPFYNDFGIETLKKSGLDDTKRYARTDRIKAIERLMEREEMQTKANAGIVASQNMARVTGEVSKLLSGPSANAYTEDERERLRQTMKDNGGKLPLEPTKSSAPSWLSSITPMGLKPPSYASDGADASLLKRVKRDATYVDSKAQGLIRAVELLQTRMIEGVPATTQSMQSITSTWGDLEPLFNDPMYQGEYWDSLKLRARGAVDAVKSESFIAANQRMELAIQQKAIEWQQRVQQSQQLEALGMNATPNTL